jgi:hypothetical protein
MYYWKTTATLKFIIHPVPQVLFDDTLLKTLNISLQTFIRFSVICFDQDLLCFVVVGFDCQTNANISDYWENNHVSLQWNKNEHARVHLWSNIFSYWACGDDLSEVINTRNACRSFILIWWESGMSCYLFLGYLAAYSGWYLVQITSTIVWKYSRKKSRGYEFSYVLGAVVLFSKICSSTKWCTCHQEGYLWHHSKSS